jgi:DNA polymerase-3 subunit epsilon/CBS domain-containing protein
VLERATPARLDAIAAMGHGRNDLAALSQAQSMFLDHIIRQQLVDIGSGMPPSNKVAVKRLSASERARLKTALSAVGHIETLTRDLLF